MHLAQQIVYYSVCRYENLAIDPKNKCKFSLKVYNFLFNILGTDEIIIQDGI